MLLSLEIGCGCPRNIVECCDKKIQHGNIIKQKVNSDGGQSWRPQLHVLWNLHLGALAFLLLKTIQLFCFSIFNVERTGEGYSRYAPCALDIYVFIVSMWLPTREHGCIAWELPNASVRRQIDIVIECFVLKDSTR